MKANKTDPHDAADLARTGFYKEVHVKSPTAHGVRSVITARGHLVEQIRELDRKLRTITSQSQACQILMGIPGVGVQTSAAFAAAFDAVGRFRHSRNAGAYFGSVPRRHQSGGLDWTGRITKQGDSMVRMLLY